MWRQIPGSLWRHRALQSMWMEARIDDCRFDRLVKVLMDDRLTESILRETLQQVERDEADAINLLCALLEKVEMSRDFACLMQVRGVIRDWQNRPPRGIVDDLARLLQGLGNGIQG